jgi:aspartyl-tRNA(Asn)/glutamyl-tRNA(Gln) amidotransferase subunit C
MQIDDKTIAHLEDLSCLTLSDGEKKLLTADLQKILNGVSRICELNTGDVPELSHPFNNVNVFRNDEVRSSFNRDLILQNAPVKTDEMFIAPRTIE